MNITRLHLGQMGGSFLRCVKNLPIFCTFFFFCSPCLSLLLNSFLTVYCTFLKSCTPTVMFQNYIVTVPSYSIPIKKHKLQ